MFHDDLIIEIFFRPGISTFMQKHHDIYKDDEYNFWLYFCNLNYTWLQGVDNGVFLKSKGPVISVRDSHTFDVCVINLAKGYCYYERTKYIQRIVLSHSEARHHVKSEPVEK
jgi:hypothetical protein